MDGLIAATAIAHDLTVATRNTADMASSGATLFDPWEGVKTSRAQPDA
jgi:predicted nucleic acid-binding protein